MSAIDPYIVNVSADVHLRDARHAHRLYTEHGLAFAPKTKFLYHVMFRANQEDGIDNTLKFKKEIGVLAKSVDLPQFRASIDSKQQYNRKKNIQTRIDYQDVTIRLHDDNVGVTRSMLEEYYRYYFVDGNNDPESGSYGPRDKYKLDLPKYGLDNDKDKPFFKDIKIYQLARQEWFSYTLINPLVSQWGHDTLENADGAGIMENSLSIAYEGVVYDSGQIGGEPLGFTDEETRYDNVPSPLGSAGGGGGAPGGGVASAGPKLNSRNPFGSSVLGRMTNISRGTRGPGVLGDLRAPSDRLPGALPSYLIPTQDSLALTGASAISPFSGRISDADTLLRGLDASPSANQSYLAKSLNSGTISSLNYQSFRGLDTPSRNTVENDLRQLIRNGDKKQQSFAQEAINQSKQTVQQGLI